MLTITDNQIRERWDTLPLNLREAIYSEDSYDIVADACAANHLSGHRADAVRAVVSDTLMGFIRADIDEVSREIRERAGIHPDIAYAIAREIDKRILLPLRNDLERVYEPPRKEKSLPKHFPETAPESMAVAAPPKETVIEAALQPESATQETPMERIISPLQREIDVKNTAREIRPSPPPAAPEEKQEPVPDTPFILHRQEEIFRPSAPPEKPSVSIAPPEPRRPASAPKKITVRIETPDGEEKGWARVVHYSAFLTPMDKDGNSNLV